jgi:hypothetical protein
MTGTLSTTRRTWPLERVLFALAGTMTLITAADHPPISELLT